MENETVVHSPHRSLIDIWTEFFNEIIDFFKYIFNDVFLGRNP